MCVFLRKKTGKADADANVEADAKATADIIHKHKMRILQVFLGSLLCGIVLGANILAVFPSVWKSHYLFGRRLLQELVESPGNHSVTLISPHAAQEDVDAEIPRIRELRIEGLRENWLDMGMSFEAEEMRAQSVMERFTRLIYAGTTNVDILLSDSQVRKLLTSGEKFDLLIVDLFLSDALLGLAFYYGIPTVAVSPTGANSWLNNMFGNPQSSSLDPSNFLPFTERMNTRQRILNSLMSTFERLTYNFFHLISQQSVYTNHFELLVKELPLYRDLTKNLSLALINSHPGLHYPRAYLPNMVEVGGLHLSNSNDSHLPKHLLSFMESAPSGVIYFSLGADVETAQLPQEKLAIILDVFGHLKEFHFLLKWEREEFTADQVLPENVMIADWWPQQAILHHPQVKMFVSSCGQLSVWESISGQKPILAIPILAEQEVMAKRLQRHGVSVAVGYDSITYDSLLHGIRQLTLNSSYVEKLGQLKERLISRDSTPVGKAVRKIQLILESGGADFLKSHANTLNFWRAEGVDVLLIIAVGFFGILTIPFLAICFILRKSYHSQAAQDQPPYRTNLKVVGRVHSYGDQGSGRSMGTESLRRTRSAQSLSARSSSSSMSSNSPTSPSTASTTPLDLTPPPPIQLLGQVPPLQLYVNQQRIYSSDRKTSQEEAERRFS
ncbi:UDP-glucosyltransferase 2 [Drosophila santomea]|uniref:UDP-glucosyltransferase 2 n=1 Tax=Drosophila santomea TaxID=129105 RepID=UPI001953F752|nr:UDP-glucosyltransferase 2 [Drosophila santomea]